MLGQDLAPDPDDFPVTGFQIIPNVGIVLLAIGRRHQHLDVLPDQFRLVPAEHQLTGVVGRADDAFVVDRDDAVNHRVEHRRPSGGVPLGG